MADHIVRQAEVIKPKQLDPCFERLHKYVDYMVHKGTGFDVSCEIARTLTGSNNCDKEVLREVYEDLEMYLSELLPYSYSLCDPVDVWLEKDPKSSPGLPMRNFYSSFEEMRTDYVEEGFSDSDVVDGLLEWERSILENRPVQISLLQAFSKRDRYSFEKIKNSRFRTIQCASLETLWLMKRYYANYVHELKEIAPFAYLITNSDQYETKVSRLRGRVNIGVDYSAFDRTESSDINRETFMMLSRLARVPHEISSYLANTVFSPCCVCPNNDVYSLGGLNPSGQFLTSEINTLNHLIYNLYYFRKVRNIKPASILKDLGRDGVYDAVMTGDDGVDSFSNDKEFRIFVDEYPKTLLHSFGVVCKLDFLDGSDPYVHVLPPYLSQVEVQVAKDAYVCVPYRPNRLLSTLQWCSTGDLKDPEYRNKRKEQLAGILVNFNAYLDPMLGKLLTKPAQLVDLLKCAEEFDVPIGNVKADVICTQHSRVSEQLCFTGIENMTKKNKNKSKVVVATVTPSVGPSGKRRRNRNKSGKLATVGLAPSEKAMLEQSRSMARKAKNAAIKEVRAEMKRGTKTLRVSPGSLRPDVVSILNQLALPYEANLVRVPASTESMTAVAKNYAVNNLVTSSILTAPALGFPQMDLNGYVWDLLNSNVDVVNFYDPYILGVYPQLAKTTGGNPNSVYGCSMFINRQYSVSTGLLTLLTSPTPNPTFTPFLLEPVEFVPVSSTVDSYGPYLPAFDTSQGRAIWIDASPSALATLTVNLTTNSQTSLADNAFFVRLFRFRKGSDTFDADAPAYSAAFNAVGVNATATAGVTVLYSGYYYVSLFGTVACAPGAVVAFNPSLSLTSRCSVISRFVVNTNLHASVYSANEVSIPFPREIQVLGAAALISNVTAPMYTDGTVYGSASLTNSVWYEFTSRSTDLITSVNAKSSYSGKWVDGIYGWVCPQKFVMRSGVERAENGIYYIKSYVIDPGNDEDDRCLGFNQFRIASSVVAGVPASKTMMRFAVAYEFQTTSQMYALGNSKILPSSLEDALFAASSMPKFTKNDIHDSAFGRAIASAGNWLLGAAKTALPYVSLASNLVSLFGNFAGSGLGTVGRVATAANAAAETFPFVTEALL